MNTKLLGTSALVCVLAACGEASGGDAGTSGVDAGMSTMDSDGGPTSDAGAGDAGGPVDASATPGEDSGAAGGDDAGDPGSDDGGGAAGDDAGGSTGSDAGSASTGRSGLVVISQTTSGGEVPAVVGTATASFNDNPASLSACTQSVHGPCVVSVCSSHGAGAAAQAGTISVSGGSQAIEIHPIASTGGYGTFVSRGELWSGGGTTLTVSAPGESGGVGAFSGTVNTPVGIVVLRPTTPSGPNPLVITRGDFEVTWSDGAAGSPAVVEFSASAGSTGVSGTCTVGSEAGALTIPGSALELIASGSMGSLGVSTGHRTTLTVGDWSVELRTVANAQNGTFQVRYE